MPDDAASRRRTFGPVVTLGLSSATVCAVAGSKPWAAAGGTAADQVASVAASFGRAEMPVANALALVCLACWGVVLVTRGRVRRVVTVLGVLAALGVVAAVVVGFSSVPDGVRESFDQVGVTGAPVSRTGWFYASALGSVLAVVAGVLAVRLVPAWPEMGSRYDAPASASASASPGPGGAATATGVGAGQPPEEPTNLDLWKAMDKGDDPTM